ncbi:MAG: hypothetical protein PVG39_18160 [Desulfobacteraceae bacterium]|jgi:hypothetical protein
MIFNLKDSTTWDPIVCDLMKSHLRNSYADILRKNSKIIQFRDSEEEACNLFSKLVSREVLKSEIKNELCDNFKEILTYHACRPIRTEDYYEKGILPLSPSKIQKQFRDYFSSMVSEKDIDTAITKTSVNTRAGVVHVVLDDRIFINCSGHYLIYGSEYLNCLTIHLPGASENHRDNLKKIGRTTIFICKLPFSSVTSFAYLVSSMMADHFFRVAHDRDDVTVIEYTISLKKPIPPDFVVDHYYPKRITDPFKRRAIWNDESMEYDYANKI